MSTSSTTNDIDTSAIETFRSAVREDPAQADRQPTVVARWTGGSRARVEMGATSWHVGGHGEPNAMQSLLGALAACDVDLVAMHAALLGIEIEELWVEATGSFNVARYLGLEADHGPGYRHVDYRVHLRARDVTDEQAARLRHLCETGSPVGDTLARRVSTAFELDVRRSSEA